MPPSTEPVSLLEELRIDIGAMRELEAAARSRDDESANPMLARDGSFGGRFHAKSLIDALNTRLVRAAELPAGNLVTDARSLARMYAATTAPLEGVRLLQPSTAVRMASEQLGFSGPSTLWPLLGPQSFGHVGGGGALGFADPQLEVGFGHVMNRLSADMGVVRMTRLVSAVSECLEV